MILFLEIKDRLVDAFRLRSNQLQNQVKKYMKGTLKLDVLISMIYFMKIYAMKIGILPMNWIHTYTQTLKKRQ